MIIVLTVYYIVVPFNGLGRTLALPGSSTVDPHLRRIYLGSHTGRPFPSFIDREYYRPHYKYDTHSTHLLLTNLYRIDCGAVLLQVVHLDNLVTIVTTAAACCRFATNGDIRNSNWLLLIQTISLSMQQQRPQTTIRVCVWCTSAAAAAEQRVKRGTLKHTIVDHIGLFRISAVSFGFLKISRASTAHTLEAIEPMPVGEHGAHPN